MRLAVIVCLFICIKVPGFSQGIEILDRDRVSKNRVRSQTLFEYDYVGGKKESKGMKARVDSFDIQGNRVAQINYRSGGTVHYIMSFKYDVLGNKTEFAKYSPGDDSKIKLNYKQSIKFDSKGNKLFETGFNGIDSFKMVYNYNKFGKLAEVNFFLQRKLDEKRIFTHSGNSADLKILDGKSKIKFTQKNLYSQSGKILEETQIEPDNTVSRKIIYTYDKKDNLTSETKYLGGKFVGKITRVYNDKGLLTEVYQEGIDGVKFLTNKYVYNDNNWLVEEQSRSENNKDFSKNTYTYDDSGLCKTIDSYYAVYKRQVLSVFVYDFY